jgi:hypothetical protein
MKSILLFLTLFFAVQTAVAQSFILNFDLKKNYADPHIFTDSSTQHTYFVFIRQEEFIQKAALCIIETDAQFRILRQSETECPKWQDFIVFQEINATHLILYIADYHATFKPELIKLQIDRTDLSYYFNRVAGLEFGDNPDYLRALTDGKKHYIVNLERSGKRDSLVVLKIENGIAKGLKRYLLPNLKDINETWKDIFKGNRAFRRSHPMLIINPIDEPNIASGINGNKLYLTDDKLVFSIKCGEEVTYMERYVRIDCSKERITTEDVLFSKPKAIENYSSNEPTSTASYIIDNYLFQAWTNSEAGVLVAKSLDSLKEIRRWEFSAQDTFSFKNSPILMNTESYWFKNKKKPLKASKELLNKMYDDGFLLTARKHDNAIEMQLGTYKYVDESVKRIALGVGFGLFGALISSTAFPDYERASYFWMSLNPNDLSQNKGAILPNKFDVLSVKTAAVPTVEMTKHLFVNGRRAILYRDDNLVLTKTTFKKYYLQIEN